MILCKTENQEKLLTEDVMFDIMNYIVMEYIE